MLKTRSLNIYIWQVAVKKAAQFAARCRHKATKHVRENNRLHNKWQQHVVTLNIVQTYSTQGCSAKNKRWEHLELMMKIITSAKKVMFLPDFVCLFACLSCLSVCVLAR